MAILEPNDFSQPKNSLTTIAESERKKLLPKNDYSTSFEYNSTNPDALASGDEFGKGTGNFLDTNNKAAGGSLDVAERVNEIKINQYSSDKPYGAPTS